MEIARELMVTPGTVKVIPTNNVYRKLFVKNFRASVTLAQALRSAN